MPRAVKEKVYHNNGTGKECLKFSNSEGFFTPPKKYKYDAVYVNRGHFTSQRINDAQNYDRKVNSAKPVNSTIA